MKQSLYCKNCQIEIFVDENMVMIKDKLWLSIAKKEEALCDNCIEKAIGRPIVESDFKSPGIPCNELWKWNKLSPEEQEKSMADFKKLSTPELRENFRVQFPKKTNHKS